MNLMSRGMSMLNTKLATAASPDTAITCRLTSDDSFVSLPNFIGTPGRIDVSNNEGDAQVRRESNWRDYCGPLSDLTDNSITEPVENMRFCEVVNGNTLYYDCKPRIGQAAWEYSDAEKTRVRVRCIQAVT